MMSLSRIIQHGWHELTRPRSVPPRLQRRRSGRRTNRRSGIALLVAVTTLMVLSVVVTELAYISRVRFLIAYHQRDRAQAYWLARSGVNIYTLILVADKQIGQQLDSATAGLDLPGIDSLWEMLPAINTGLMRMLFSSGGASASVDDIDDEELEEFQQTGRVSDEVAESSRGEGSSLFSDRTFLDFEGDFSAEVFDHESKIDVNMFAGEDGPITDSATAQYLFALMSGEESEQWLLERNLDRWELIGNIRDWVDSNNTRDAGLGGYEDTLYNNLEPGYLAKNAKFDTIDEIRLVEGWQDEVFDQYGQYLTIYANGKTNPNRWEERQHAAAISQATGGAYTYDAALSLACLTPPADSGAQLTLYDTTFTNKNNYIQQVETYCSLSDLDASKLTLTFTNRSSVFTIKSTGLVGTSATTITTVIDFSSTNLGKTRYWRVE